MPEAQTPSQPPPGAPKSRRPWWARALMSLVRIAIMLYVGLMAVAVFSDQLLFRPHASSYADDGSIVRLTCADGVKIAAMWLPNPSAAWTVIYSHGNGEDMGDVRYILEELRSCGVAVLAYDYHGYGLSDGKPGETAAYRDIESAYEYLTGTLGVPPGRIIIYGRSIGSGPSIYLAARRPVAGLVVESGFTSAFRIVTRVRLLPWDKFDNLDTIAKVHCPVLVMHGRQDKVIAFAHGPRLFEAANEPKQCFWCDAAGHNDMVDVADAEYRQAFTGFLELVKARANQPAPDP